MARLLSSKCWGSSLLALMLACSSHGFAQHGGGGGGHGGGGMGGPGGMSGGSPGFAGGGTSSHDYGHASGPGNTADSAGSASVRGGLQLGPPGRWWDDKHFAKSLKLRPDQQRRMDSVFESNRSTLLTRLSAVQQEQTRLEAITRSKTPDENTLDMQIDRVWQSLAELEKAKTHYLLQIRQEMDADQVAKLEDAH